MAGEGVLVVDDDHMLLDVVTSLLQRAGLRPRPVDSVADAGRLLDELEPALLIMDIQFGGPAGRDLLRDVRETRPEVMVLVLVPLGPARNRAAPHPLGADDYLPKPFDHRELVGRARALLARRTPAARAPVQPARVQLGSVSLDPVTHLVLRDGSPVPLTPIEFRLLQRLMAQPDADVSPATLMVEVWGRDNPRALRLTTTRLRAKLESDPAQPRYVQDAPGGGVRFHDHGAGSPPDSPIAPGSPVDFEVVAELRDLLDDRDAAAFRELRERFSRTIQEATGLMRAATTAADASTLGVEAHRLRGSSAVIGALRINALAALLEQRARAADLATVPSILDQLPAELRLFEQALVPLLA